MVIDGLAGHRAPHAPVPGILPEDLAELQGAVRLTFACRSASGGDRMLAPYLYALARGWYGAEDIADRTRDDACLRHLAGGEIPAAAALRRFRRQHGPRLAAELAGLVASSLAAVDGVPRLGFDPGLEAGRRLRMAVAADSLAAEP